jgi:UPF0176 protein
MTQYHITTFYKFFDIQQPLKEQAVLKYFCVQQKLLGTILVAHEGLNGTVAGSAESIEKLKEKLFTYGLSEGDFKYSTTYVKPFNRMKVRLKKELITMKQDNVDPTKVVGTYVTSHSWNDLISQDDVVVLDTRNDFEVKYGTFENAINPKIDKFTEFADYVKQNLDPKTHKKIAMFCTGGIRCEKASAYMLNLGFEEVYHLKGGILQYMTDVSKYESKWQGDCFVFDDRIAVRP